jgi:hypothetical protein
MGRRVLGPDGWPREEVRKLVGLDGSRSEVREQVWKPLGRTSDLTESTQKLLAR